jgi:hypothetical protein
VAVSVRKQKPERPTGGRDARHLCGQLPIDVFGRTLSLSHALPFLSAVPSLIGVHLLTHLQPQGPQTFEGLAHLNGLRLAVQVFVLDPRLPVPQRNPGRALPMRHSPSRIEAGVLQDESAVGLHGIFPRTLS